MKNRKNHASKKITAAIAVAAVALIAFGGITGARAALTYSEIFRSDFGTQNIGVGLVEQTGTNDAEQIPDDGELLTKLVGEDESFIVGKVYDELLSAENTGTIDEYVRMTVRKYWLDGNGKRVDLSPELINLTFNEDEWIMVDTDPADETIVLYYKAPLTTEQGTTEEAVKTIGVDSEIAKYVDQTITGKTIQTEFAYDGLQIALDVDVDGVQTHHAQDAMLSAWGVNATFSGDALTAVN